MTLARVPRLVGPTGAGRLTGRRGLSRIPRLVAAPPSGPTGLLVSDTFDRTDRTPLGTPQTGPAWASLTATSLSVLGSEATASSTAARMDVVECGATDVTVKVTVVAAPATGGPVARVVDASNYLWVAGSTLRQVVAGVSTNLASLSGGILDDGQVVELVASGSTVTVRRDGATVATATTTLLAGTRHGLRTTSLGSFDDFTVTAP